MATVKWEHLKCEFPEKPHNWKRPEGSRGRKPRFCPKHRSEPKLSSASTDLYCENGKHNWVRPPTRGRVPTSCPDHREQRVIVSAPRNKNGMVTLHCETGNHDWERLPQRGRKPINCPKHSGVSPVTNSPVNVNGKEESVPVEKKRRGRPRIHETKEEAAEAALQKSRERAANLEGALKERGTHISQQTPYILYKKTAEKPGRNGRKPTVTWDKVTEHSPLQQAQYINSHGHDFESGAYRYERNGKVVVL